MQKEFQQIAYTYLIKAADKGVGASYYYLGTMYEEGIYATKDGEAAVDCYISGAAKNNAYCFYKLSILHGEGRIVEKDPYLEFRYLKRSAEEGFVLA